VIDVFKDLIIGGDLLITNLIDTFGVISCDFDDSSNRKYFKRVILKEEADLIYTVGVYHIISNINDD
jgi:hypothetical protein